MRCDLILKKYKFLKTSIIWNFFFIDDVILENIYILAKK